MALLHVGFYSQMLRMQSSMDVILPETNQGIGVGGAPPWDGKSLLPVLYLLHGTTDDQTIWQRRTSIERYAAGRPLAVVMPNGHLSAYCNQKYGHRYLDFITTELPEICQKMFRISPERKDNFIAGLSMGGYGAFKLGVLCHDKFAAVASLSGAVDVAAIMDRNTSPEFFSVFGENTRGSENDIIAQLEKLIAEGASLPRFYQACGTEDFLYLSNTAFRDRFKDRIDLTYEEGPGVHNWDFWDEYIRHVLKWLPIK